MGREGVDNQQGLDEWLIDDEENLAFHIGQIEKPYRSTVGFEQFLIRQGVEFNKKLSIVEAGCGAGQVLGYFLRKYPKLQGLGLELNEKLISLGNKVFNEKNLHGKLEKNDIYNLQGESLEYGYDGVILLQVINVLPEYEKALSGIQRIKHRWIAFSMLGFEGNIDYICTLHDYNKPKNEGGYSEVFYNIWSIPRMHEYLLKLGYTKIRFNKFDIDIDLPITNPEGRGTYTVKLEDGNRMQISGGMWMPWYFAYAEK